MQQSDDQYILLSGNEDERILSHPNDKRMSKTQVEYKYAQ